MSWRPAAVPAQHPVAISTASAAADIFNIESQSTAVFMTLCAAEKDHRSQVTFTSFIRSCSVAPQCGGLSIHTLTNKS